MKAFGKNGLASCITAGVLGCASVGLATAQEFTYQGQLRDGGLGANGAYDFQFRLLNQLNTQVGSPQLVNDLFVDGGLFNVELDFGAGAFNGDARFLEISVRPGASSGAYTKLNPNQPITPAPYAIYALNGGFWQASGNNIENTNAGFVGINRSTTVSAAEYFGIQAPATGTNYGGMYIRTDSADARPFYGYKAGSSGDTAWTYLDGQTGAWHVYNLGNRLSVLSNGNVGVNTTSPATKLNIEVGGTGAGFRVQNGPDMLDIAPNSINTEGDGFLGDPLWLNNNTSSGVIIGSGGGNTGVGGGASTFPLTKLHVDGGADASLTAHGFLMIGDLAKNIVMDDNEIMARADSATAPLALNAQGGNVTLVQGGTGNVGIGTSAPAAKLHVVGTTRTSVLEITGGSDLSEGFDVSGSDIEPGMVVVIDPANPGKLLPACSAYDQKVAGVISGAGGVNTGMVMGQSGSIADGKHPVALTGRVYVLCDASAAGIEPGDLLTTSDTRGHAMKAGDRERAHGAIIGKAMTSLAAGERGLVLVLVNLQ